MAATMYRVTINGHTIECETRAELTSLIGDVTPPKSAPQSTTAQPPTPPEAPAQAAVPGLKDEVQSRWTEPARKIIALLLAAGRDGLDADRVAEAAGIKNSRGNSPLLKEVIALLGVDDSAIERSRNDEGKRRWVLTPKGKKAAAKIDLPDVGVGRG